ncbi:MAG: ABC transporter substrate-binding protein [Bacteroidales bacterium]
MAKYKFHIILLIVSAILTLIGCGRRQLDGIANEQLTIATLKGPSSMGMIKLIDSLSQGDSHKVKVAILDEPLQARKMMIDGSADFVILPTTMGAITYNKGFDYRLVAVPVWGTLYLVGNDTSIKCWNDLKGKRVFVMARGMTPDELFRYLLLRNGIDPEKDVTLDYSFPTHIDLANAAGAGMAKIGVLSEPLASIVIKKNKTLKRIFSLDEEWKKSEEIPLAETAFMAKANVLKNSREITEKLISSYGASTNWVNQYPDSAAQLIVKYNILPDYEAALNAIPLSNLKFVRASVIRNEINEYLKVFYRLNPDIIGGKIPDEDFIYQ